MKKIPLRQVASDLVLYIDEMTKLGKNLNTEQQESLAGVFEVILILLVALRKNSKLGLIESPFPFL